MDIVTFVYIVVGWFLFHWSCYAFLARKLVRSERFRQYSVPAMTCYAGIGSCVSTVLIFVAISAVRDMAIAATIAGILLIIASCWVWAARFTDPAFRMSGLPITNFVLPPPSTSIVLPVLGPLFALLWMGMSFGLDELIGAGDEVQSRDREKGIGYVIASIAAILLVIYLVSVALIELFGISMYGYFFK
jgi:hypothetical protein